MPRVHKRTARQDIYWTGVKVADPKTKSGYRRDRSKPNPEGDELRVAKGEVYYTWKFRYGGQQISKTYPKRQQLTQSDFMIQQYDFEDELASFHVDDYDDLEAAIEDIVERLGEFRDEQQEKLDNMPEQLQYAPSGEILQERIDMLENVISELENIDCSLDEDADDWKKEYYENEYSDLAERAEMDGGEIQYGDPGEDDPLEDMAIVEYGKTLVEIQDEINDKWSEHLGEKLAEKLEEISSVQFG